NAWWRAAACAPAASGPLDRLYLQEIELDRRRASEDRHHDLDLLTLGIHFVHYAGEIGERPVDDLDVLAGLERNLGRAAETPAGFHVAENPFHLGLAERDRILTRSHEPGDSGHVLNDQPCLLIQVYLDEHIGGKRLPLRRDALAVLHFGEFLCRDEDLAEVRLETRGVDRPLQIRLYLVL